MNNLDVIAAERAQQVVRRTKALIIRKPSGEEVREKPGDLDNTVTKTLGVLQEDGVYAAFLFLLSRPAKEAARAKIVREEMLDLLKAIGFEWQGNRPSSAEDVLKYLTTKVTGDTGENALEQLMLAKETLEQMLVYARYGAKAWGQEPRAESSTGG